MNIDRIEFGLSKQKLHITGAFCHHSLVFLPFACNILIVLSRKALPWNQKREKRRQHVTKYSEAFEMSSLPLKSLSLIKHIEQKQAQQEWVLSSGACCKHPCSEPSLCAIKTRVLQFENEKRFSSLTENHFDETLRLAVARCLIPSWKSSTRYMFEQSFDWESAFI